MKSLFVLAFLLCISVASGLKCYGCVSTKSWDSCADVRKEVDCTSGMDRCYKAYADIKGEGASVEGYKKGCLSAAGCDAFNCKGKGDCKIDCCTGDLCNAAALPMASTIILIACAFVAYAF